MLWQAHTSGQPESQDFPPGWTWNVFSQLPVRVYLGHHKPDLVAQSDPKPLHEGNVIADDELAGTNELLHIHLQVSSSL